MCVRVAVTCELEIEDVSVIVEATSGMSVIRMSGVAFTSATTKTIGRSLKRVLRRAEG